MSDDRTWGVLASQSDEDALRTHITGTADEFHAEVAGREIHWQHPSCGAWLAREGSNGWVGWDSRGESTGIEADCWTPWQSVLDESAAPYYKWFTGGQTNACFNLVDRHLLLGRADKTAIIFEGDRWDPSKNNGRGGPVTEQHFSYRKVFEEIIARMQVLREVAQAVRDGAGALARRAPQKVRPGLGRRRRRLARHPRRRPL